MKRIHLRASVVALACLVMAWTPPARAAEQFSASFTGNANPMISTDPCIWTNTETGSGTSTLGEFDWESSETADFCAILGEVVVHGQFELIFETGTIAGEYQTVGEPQLVQRQIYFFGAYEHGPDGGTGTFSGSAGTGFIDAIASGPPGWDFTATMSGEIERGTPGP